MSNLNLRRITNHFQDVRLVSMASWRQANEFSPRDRGGPYVVLQEGYDPEDPSMNADEFVLGRCGKWLSLAFFFRLPIPERRSEFVFGTAGEVMQMMSNLPPKVAMMDRPAKGESTPDAPENDEMATTIRAAKGQNAS